MPRYPTGPRLACSALDQPRARPPGTLKLVLFARAEWLVDQALNARFVECEWQYIYWRLQLQELLDCSEHYLGLRYRRTLQRYIAAHLAPDG